MPKSWIAQAKITAKGPKGLGGRAFGSQCQAALHSEVEARRVYLLGSVHRIHEVGYWSMRRSDPDQRLCRPAMCIRQARGRPSAGTATTSLPHAVSQPRFKKLRIYHVVQRELEVTELRQSKLKLVELLGVPSNLSNSPQSFEPPQPRSSCCVISARHISRKISTAKVLKYRRHSRRLWHIAVRAGLHYDNQVAGAMKRKVAITV